MCTAPETHLIQLLHKYIFYTLSQYRTTRTALGDPTGTTTTTNSTYPNSATSTSASALLNQSVVVDSDSDGDFPASVKSSDEEG